MFNQCCHGWVHLPQVEWCRCGHVRSSLPADYSVLSAIFFSTVSPYIDWAAKLLSVFGRKPLLQVILTVYEASELGIANQLPWHKQLMECIIKHVRWLQVTKKIITLLNMVSMDLWKKSYLTAQLEVMSVYPVEWMRVIPWECWISKPGEFLPHFIRILSQPIWFLISNCNLLTEFRFHNCCVSGVMVVGGVCEYVGRMQTNSNVIWVSGISGQMCGRFSSL